MATRIETFFTATDRDAIREATTAAEQKTAGEIVVYVIERCDPHPEVGWKSAMVGAAVGALVAAAIVLRFGGWGAPDNLFMLIGLQLGLLAGWIAGRFDGVARRLIGDEALDSRVDGRAAEAFIEEQVFATRDRTGVLIFVALFEHRVVILADQGIDERVADDAWDRICGELTAGIRRGEPSRALIHAVDRCVELLVAHGVDPDDAGNQLSNRPRFRDE